MKPINAILQIDDHIIVPMSEPTDQQKNENETIGESLALSSIEPPLNPGIVITPSTYDAPISESRTKRHFSLEEDLAIKALVAEHGTGQWGLIASRLVNRNARQVRDRWKNYLAPTVVGNQDWTINDDKLLISLVQNMGKQWSQITKYFPGRTDVHLKNHWNKLERHAKKISPQGTFQMEPLPPELQAALGNLEPNQEAVPHLDTSKQEQHQPPAQEPPIIPN